MFERLKKCVAYFILFAFAFTGKAYAASITYDLTGDPNLGVWAGETLATVTLTDNAGAVDFKVEVTVPGTRLDQFGFNFLNNLEPANFLITGLPTLWVYSVDIDKQGGFNGFGKFDVDVVNSDGQTTRVAPLEFTVTSTDAITIANFQALSDKGTPAYFAAHVTDLDTRGPAYGSCTPEQVAAEECSAITGYAGAVPVPAAVWLFGSGLIGLAGLARRKRI